MPNVRKMGLAPKAMILADIAANRVQTVLTMSEEVKAHLRDAIAKICAS